MRRSPPTVALRDLRAEARRTQHDLAQAIDIVQGEVSVLERRDDWEGVRVGTIRRYVEALGFQLELVAVRGDAVVSLAPLAPSKRSA